MTKLSLRALACASLCAFALTGCTLVNNAAPSAVAIPAISGTTMGGETPILGAAMILWETDPGNTGYGLTAKQLATATSQANGAFSFSTSYTCDAGQFVYITGTGGDVTNGSANPMVNNNNVQMAALGSCSNFANATAKGKVIVALNEVSTVAAAYTLNNFMTVTSSSTGNQLVYIGAPANNNATTGSCSGTGTSMTCVAAGLSHAFANALNLTDSVHFDGTTPTGLALTTVAGNAASSVPQAEIHMFANLLQYCTNTPSSTSYSSVTVTNGGTGYTAPTVTFSGGGSVNQATATATVTAGVITSIQISSYVSTYTSAPTITIADSTGTGATAVAANGLSGNCSSLFSHAQPASGTAPADTLSAMIDIAKNPKHNTSTLYGYVPATGAAFQPTLASVPKDLTLAITYTGVVVGGTTTNITYPEDVALDANDNVYVLATNSASAAALTSGVVALSSSGTGIWANPQSVAQCSAAQLATDILGNVWETVGPTTSTAVGGCFYAIYGYSATTGAQNYLFAPSTAITGATYTPDSTHAISSQANGIAIDRFNNVWYSRKSTSCTGCLVEFPYTAGSPGTYGAAANTQTSLPLNDLQMQFDANSNLYMSASTGSTEYVLFNTGTANAPTYTAGTGITTLVPSSAATGLGALDGSGNLWVSGSGKLTEFAAPITTSSAAASTTTITAVSSAATSPTTPYFGVVDGANTLWYPSHTSSGQVWFSYLGSTGLLSDYIYTCQLLPAVSSTTCNNQLTSGAVVALNTLHRVVVDSTGAVWAPGSFTGYVEQIFGPGAPTWPEAQYAVYGTMPK